MYHIEIITGFSINTLNRTNSIGRLSIIHSEKKCTYPVLYAGSFRHFSRVSCKYMDTRAKFYTRILLGYQLECRWITVVY